MDSKKLSAFLTVKKLGSLTAAAAVLNYTQSGMTHMMNALEKELGVTLLHRGRSGISLTDRAEQLLPEIEAFVQSAAALEDALTRTGGSSAAGIRVGAYSSMAQHWLPEIVQRFRREFPCADISIRMGPVQDIYAWLKNGELDCAFVSFQPGEMTDALKWVPLHRDELVAVLPEAYPADGTSFDVSGFQGKEFLMPTDGFELDIEPMLRRAGVQPDVRYTNLDDPAIISMVEHGLGITVLTRLVMRDRKDRVLALPLAPQAFRELGIALRKDGCSHELMGRFTDHARAAVFALYNA